MNQLPASNKIDTGVSSQISSTLVADRETITVGAGGVLVKGNVEGNIQVLNKKIEVNADHGAVVNLYDAPPRVKKRDAVPQPTRPLRGFVNRKNELKWLEQITSAGEVATIYAMDGMGKSALLRQAANSSAAQNLPDGILFMEGIDEHGQALGTEDVIQRLFDKSFESEPRLKVNFDTAQTYLSNLKPLVILNGLDLPTSSLSRMPDLYPHGAMLIESNQWTDDDSSEGIRLGPLPRTEAIELLAAKAGITPDDEMQPILDSICALLADVPLAIVIAARAIRENSLSLEHAHDVLASIEPGAAEANRRGIERAYALAQSTLTELEREWLAAAALAPGVSIDPRYLHQMAKDEASAEHTQERLQAMGLLTANSPRLRIHPGVRALAHAGVDEIPLQERFITYLKTMLKTNSLDWNYCTDELGNIIGMIDWAASHRRWSDVISLGRAIDAYLTLHGLWEAWRTIIENVLRSARRLDDRVNEAWALHQLGTHAIGVGWSGQAIDFLQQALDLRGQLGDTIGMAYTRHNLDLLIPPAASGKGNEKPPNKPTGGSSSLGRTLKFLLKTVIVGAVVAGGGYLLTAKALDLPFIPETGRPRSVTKMPASTATLPATFTSTPAPSHPQPRTSTLTATKTLTPTITPTLTDTSAPVLACSPKLTGLKDANCRVGPSTVYDVYGTLFQDQTVEILGVNEEGTWFMVDHPQAFRNPCWVWNGPAVQVQGDLSCAQVIVVPVSSEEQSPPSQGQSAPSEEQPAPSDEPSDPVGGTTPGGPVPVEPPYQIEIVPFVVSCQAGLTCQSGYYWDPDTCSCKERPIYLR